MINVLIYLKSTKRPFELSFQTERGYDKFKEQLQDNAYLILTIGPLTFAKSEFAYCLQK